MFLKNQSLFFICLFILIIQNIQLLEFDMVSQTKCISQDFHKNSLVIIDYEFLNKQTRAPIKLDAKLMDSQHVELHHKIEVTSGQASFTASRDGEYKICFWTSDPLLVKDARISIKISSGIQATDWVKLAKENKMDEIQMEIVRLETLTHGIHDHMKQLKEQEEIMRDISELSSGRVMWISLLSILILIGLGGYQVWYLQSYLKKRKII